MPDQDQHPPGHHLLIAGTGRAGTSFLVRWLAAAGLRTHLATHATPEWDEDANAGLEDIQAAIDWKAAPYVVKSPWFVEVIDDVLADPQVVLDGVIIPVRDLTEAAASRVVQERQSAHRRNAWMIGLGRSFEQWGTTPGGVVFSLDPVDQARLLAVSFHRLVQRLVKADVPVVLLDFPRLALDADYLFYKLRRFIPATITQARDAHAAIADPEKIRVAAELAGAPASGARPLECETHTGLEAAALRREVRRLRGELAQAERAAAAQQAAVTDLRNAQDMQVMALAGLVPATPASDDDRQAASDQVASLIAAIGQRRAEAERAAEAQQAAFADLRGTLDAQAAELAGLATRLAARDAALEVTQSQVNTLTAAVEHWRAEAERAAAESQAETAALRCALDSRSAELAQLATTLEGRDTDLQAAQARVATLTGTMQQERLTAERDLAEQQAAATALRSTLAAQATDLAGMAANLVAAQAEAARLTAVVDQSREAHANSWVAGLRRP